MKAEAGDAYLFPGKGKSRHQVELKRFWSQVREEAGLEDLRLHDLRHSFAAILASSGCSLPVIGAYLGHSQPQTTARYAHLLDAPLRDAAEKAAGFLQEVQVR
jgi:integrase